MFSNRFAFFLVAVACVGAAAGGSYLATRQNIASMAQAAPAAVPASTTSAVAATPAPNASAAAAPADASIDRATDARVMPVPAATTPAPAPERPHVAPPAQAAEAKNKKAPATIVARNAAPAPARASAPAVQPPAATTAPEPAPMPSPAPEIARQDDVRAPEPPRIVEPERAPEKQFDELVVSADSVIGLQLETSLSSERARVEDRVEARVARDVRVGSHVAIPAGARVIGSVMVVEKGSKFKDRARLGIRFNTLMLGNGTRVPITTETIFRYGDPPSNSSASKIGGGAVIGTIIGGILGGGKGAAAGAAVGAGGGAVAAANADTSAAEFPVGMQMTARFLAPVSVTVER
jgi:type IV secretory pathway VirB10-like protein